MTVTKTFQYHSIEQVEYEAFAQKFKAGEFGNQRYGQAFFNHFKLHKMTADVDLNRLYEMDGDDARLQIHALFHVH